jgi:hypothetical protein
MLELELRLPMAGRGAMLSRCEKEKCLLQKLCNNKS